MTCLSETQSIAVFHKQQTQTSCCVGMQFSLTLTEAQAVPQRANIQDVSSLYGQRREAESESQKEHLKNMI